MDDIHDSPSGKTSPERSRRTKAKTSEQSSKRLPKSGRWTLRGGYATLDTSESPNDAVESSLSQILEANVSTKYYLSAKACAGILRRAQKRGKTLPDMLRIALEETANRGSQER